MTRGPAQRGDQDAHSDSLLLEGVGLLGDVNERFHLLAVSTRGRTSVRSRQCLGALVVGVLGRRGPPRGAGVVEET